MTPPSVEPATQDARRERQTLGRAHPLLIAFSVSAILGSFVFAWGWVAAPPDTLSTVINVVPAFALVVLVNYLAATSGVRGDGAGFIQVDGLLLQRVVPIGAIDEVRSSEGLVLHLRSGRKIKSAAYPWTTSGRVANFPRARRAASRIQEFIDRHPESQTSSLGISLRPRPGHLATP